MKPVVFRGNALDDLRAFPVAARHCFQKKTQKTGKADIDSAARRYRELIRELGL